MVNDSSLSKNLERQLDEIDPLATLTASSSSSSSKAPVFPVPVTSSPAQIHPRRFSLGREAAPPTSPEFGAFVTASAADDDPLLGGSSHVNESEAPSKSEFDRFAEEAKARTESNERRLLDELRQHEIDPLAWLGRPEGDSTSTGSKGTPDGEGDSGNLLSALHEAGSTLIDLSTPITEGEPPSSARRPQLGHHDQPTLPRAVSDTSLHSRSHSPAQPTPSSSFSGALGAGLARSWMNTLLSSSHAASASSSSASALGTHLPNAPPAQADIGLPSSPTQSRLQALFSRSYNQSLPSNTPSSPSPSIRHSRFLTEGHLPTHAATLPASVSSGLPLSTPGPSPFASHPYIPPSGAPGFGGDRNWNESGFEFDESKTLKKKVELLGRRAPTTPVLETSVADALRPHLPALARLPNNWTLLYSTDQDGLSLNTLYARCTPQQVVGGGGKLHQTGPTGALLALQDAEGGIFGAWVADGVHLSHGSYYGGGDAFLWRINPHDDHDLQVYKWTGRNDYVALCDKEGFSFGGGDGHYGLYVDGTLVEGTTHSCPTFDNDCLARGSRHGRMVSFDCVGLEVWGIGP